MKRFIAYVSMLLVVWTTDAMQPGELTSLPINSRSAIAGQIQREITGFYIQLSNLSGPSMGTNALYDSSMGSLESVIRTNMIWLFNTALRTSDAGRHAYFLYFPIQGSLSPVVENWIPVGFTVQLDGAGKPIIPFSSLLYPSSDGCSWKSWALSECMPITGAGTDVTSVDYVTINNSTGQRSIVSTPNGVGCSRISSDGVLYFQIGLVDPDCAVPGYSREITLWYSFPKGIYEVFDGITGAKLRSTLICLTQMRTNNVNYVKFTGMSGKQVAIETSSNLFNWTSVGSPITIGQNGSSVFTNTILTRPLFFRGRLLSPP